MAFNKKRPSESAGPSGKRSLTNDLSINDTVDIPLNFNMINMYNNSPDSTVYLAPLECAFRDFSLIKDGSKYFRIGVDVRAFTPFVSLVSKGSRQSIHISVSEFLTLVASDTLTDISQQFKGQTDRPPQNVGDIQLSVRKTGQCKTVRIEKNNTRVFLAESTWIFINKMQQLMLCYLSDMENMCKEARNNFSPLVSLAKMICVSNSNYVSEDSFIQCETLFPTILRYEMVCYHSEYVREILHAAIQNQ